MSRKKGLIIDSRDICYEEESEELDFESHKKKNFSNVKGEATPDTISAVADPIKLVLANPTRNTLVNEISVLQDNA